jgi:hypothetical protein
VLNWSISRNHKEIWNSTKISVTPGMYVTRGDSVQRLLTSGPRGWTAGRPSFESVRTKTSWTRVYTRRERLWQWRKLVEAAWRVTASAKSVELPHGPINNPLPVKIDTHTHTPHFGDSTCKAPILTVIARHRLVGRVVNL